MSAAQPPSAKEKVALGGEVEFRSSQGLRHLFSVGCRRGESELGGRRG